MSKKVQPANDRDVAAASARARSQARPSPARPATEPTVREERLSVPPPSAPAPVDSSRARPAAAKRGRPRGPFTQARRLEVLRALLMRHPRGLSIYDLARELAVTPRAIRRYLSEVRRELDLVTVAKRPGGVLLWRLAPGEVVRKVEVRRTQAYAFLAARRLFEPMRGSTLYAEIDIACDKLLAVARRPGRGPNAGVADARLEDRFLYLPFAPKDYAQRTEELDDLFQAVADLRPLTCRYIRARDGREEKITLHPYALVLYKDAIYCVARHTDKGDVRTFLLDRMRDTECAINERFELPENFNVEDYFQGQFGIWHGGEPQRVVVDFDARVREYVETRRIHPSQSIEPLPDGGARLTMTIGDLTEVTTWVLGFGETARVVEPPELARKVITELENALARYAAHAQRSPAPTPPPQPTAELPPVTKPAAAKRPRRAPKLAD
ncbi:MAG: transcriptional regulator [Polyangiaceae bacterium]